jgi:hypothetical protein
LVLHYQGESDTRFSASGFFTQISFPHGPETPIVSNLFSFIASVVDTGD